MKLTNVKLLRFGQEELKRGLGLLDGPSVGCGTNMPSYVESHFPNYTWKHDDDPIFAFGGYWSNDNDTNSLIPVPIDEDRDEDNYNVILKFYQEKAWEIVKIQKEQEKAKEWNSDSDLNNIPCTQTTLPEGVKEVKYDTYSETEAFVTGLEYAKNTKHSTPFRRDGQVVIRIQSKP